MELLQKQYSEKLFPVDDALKYKLDDKDAPVKLHIDKDKNEATLTIHDGVKWNNGEDLTSKRYNC